jgi:hypothetical protein
MHNILVCFIFVLNNRSDSKPKGSIGGIFIPFFRKLVGTFLKKQEKLSSSGGKHESE